jgi:aryl-alcohol dehydrogenase-like predicted oxidoreductase
MQQRTLGRSGLSVSVVGLGCNNFGGRTDVAGARAVVDRALEAGITLFDTADVYGNAGGSESALGEILGARRSRIVLATKVGKPMDGSGTREGSSRRYIVRAVEDSLRRLRTEWIDLYQLHDPDPGTPIEETLRTLDDLIAQGKVRYIGCSNFAAWQVVDAQWTARTRGYASFISCQDEYSLLARGVESTLVPAMRAFGLGLVPYFPLAGGLLTGKYERGAPLPAGTRFTLAKGVAGRYLNDANWDIVEGLRAFCRERGRSMLELAFSWIASRPLVASVIAGAMTPEQVEANVRAAGWELTSGDLAEIDRITARV